jgi:hypothetical protein
MRKALIDIHDTRRPSDPPREYRGQIHEPANGFVNQTSLPRKRRAVADRGGYNRVASGPYRTCIARDPWQLRMSGVQNQLPQQAVNSADKSPPTRLPAAREQFIPLRKAELVDVLADSAVLPPAEADGFRRVCGLVEGILHREFHATLEELKNAYAPFDPDADTRPGPPLSDAKLAAAQQALFQKFGWLLERGNFQRLKQHEIERALKDRSHWGLNLAVNFDVFERLELYFRGDTTGTRFRRRLTRGFRTESVDVPIFQRLVLIFRLRSDRPLSKYLDTHDVHIKLFKDIPQLDVEMLLPGTEARMSLVDRARIMLPTLSGVSMTVWKVLAGGTVLLYSSLAFLLLVGGTVGYGVRSLYGYLNTKQKYQLNLTQSLYYQNLDNNAGVIHRLLDEAEEQENREAILGYFFLWRKQPSGGWTSAEVDREIEAFLATQGFGGVDFEIGDSLAKLQRLGLVESCAPDKWKAVPVEKAIEVLGRAWSSAP